MDSFGLVKDVIYNRRKDIHPRFGGNRYSGIAPAPSSKVVLIFSGKEGHAFGYSDEWDADQQTLTYTGEGQEGDMEFTNGNLAIRDHIRNGHALLLFEKVDRSGLYRYVGEMQCAGTSGGTGPDRLKKIRQLIKFQLVRIDSVDAAASDPAVPVDHKLEDAASTMLSESPVAFDELRKRAYEAIASNEETPKQARRNLYKRSVSVAAYVLARAAGHCEGCNEPAPFKRKNGTPYLEVHHIERLSDGGLDAPDHVAALCPTCHRRVHHGSDREPLTKSVRAKVLALEAKPASAPDADSL